MHFKSVHTDKGIKEITGAVVGFAERILDGSDKATSC